MADSSIVSRPLADLTYKELQNIAMLLSLPANLKRSVMRTLIQARKDGREELVQRLLMNHREQRCRNRPTGSDNRNHHLTTKEIYKEEESGPSQLKMGARRWRQKKITPHPYSSEAVIPPLRPLLPRGELPPVKMAEGEYDAEDTISSVIGVFTPQ
uniref:Uncharacterized protein n=1 Tax=Timema cristinae TaxID=61476 RepID=A0A7R9D8V9_TIMCR|nr:unnamed protein product [Timema cristinae]